MHTDYTNVTRSIILRKQQQRKVDYTATQLLLQPMRIMKEEANPIIIIIIAITTPASLKPEPKKNEIRSRSHACDLKSQMDDILAANSSQVVYKFFPQSRSKSGTSLPERARARKDRSIDDMHSYIHSFLHPSVATSISTSITTSITAPLCECIHPRIKSIYVGSSSSIQKPNIIHPSSSSPLQNIHS